MEEQTATTEESGEEVTAMSAPSAVHKRLNWGTIGIIASIAISAVALVLMFQADNDNTRQELKEEIHREIGDIREEIRDDNAATVDAIKEVRGDIQTFSGNVESRLDAVERNQASLEGDNTVLKDILVSHPPEGDGR